MADEVAVEGSGSGTVSTPPKPDYKPRSVLAKVANKLAGSGPAVHAAVVDALAEKEINSRTELVVEAVKQGEALQKQFDGLRPDQAAAFDGEGAVTREAAWSQKALENKRKLGEKLSKLDAAMETALDKNNYEPLRKLVNELKQQAGGSNPPNAQPQS